MAKKLPPKPPARPVSPPPARARSAEAPTSGPAPSSGARRKAVAIDMHATLAMVVPASPATPATVDAVSFATSGRERLVPLASIRRDPRAQPRARLNPETVEAYRAAMAPGEGEPAWGTFPAVVLYQEGDVYHLADGFHRLAAAEGAGLAEARAEVHRGDLRAAILHSVGANATHGLPRTNEDKRRAVQALLGDTEWSTWSDRVLAAKAAVSHTFVANLRADPGRRGPHWQPLPVSEGGGHEGDWQPLPVGANHEEPPRRLATVASQAAEAPATRRGKDGRTIRTQNIGKPPRHKPSVRHPAAASVDPLDKALTALTEGASGLSAAGRTWLAKELGPVVAKLRARGRK